MDARPTSELHIVCWSEYGFTSYCSEGLHSDFPLGSEESLLKSSWFFSLSKYMVIELNFCTINFYRFIPCEVLNSDCDIGEHSRLLGFDRLVNSHQCFWGACCTIFVVGNYSSMYTSPYSRRLESSVVFYILHISSLKVIILSTREADKSVIEWNTNWETTWRKDCFSFWFYAVRLTFFPSVDKRRLVSQCPLCVSAKCKISGFSGVY
jgi:hypothetical protein